MDLSARQARHAVVLCLVAALAAWFSTEYLRLFIDASTTVEDLLVSAARPEQQNEDIVIVTITEATLAQYPYREPIRRDFLAATIETLMQKGARLVAIDLIFDRPTEDDLDRTLADTLRNHRNAIVVAIGDAQSELDEDQLAFQARYLDGITTGLADIYVRRGVVRDIYPGRAENPVAYPSFVAAIARKLGLEPPLRLERLYFQRTAAGGAAPIRTFPASFVDIYPDELFAGKVVLIGVDLPDKDRWRTPLTELGGGSTAGVQIHAQSLAQIMEGRSYPGPGLALSIAMLLAFVVAGYLIPLTTVHAAIEALGAVVVLFLFWTFAYILARVAGVIVPVVLPTVGLLAGAVLSVAHERYRESRQKRFLTGAFKRYVAPDIIDEIIAHPEKLVLGGTKRELSFVFCDLAGFTSLSEQLAPEIVVSELQEYFDGMLAIALEHAGTIDRLVGDGMAVIFGAPVARPDHAERAVSCAIALDRFSEAFRARRIAAGVDWGITRIGVHTGAAVVGNVGSRKHFHYTAHGDCVNTAARLEGANRLLGTRVCISCAAADQHPAVTFRPIGCLVLKGKTQPLECVTLPEPLSREQLHLYRQAYTLLQNGDRAASELLDTLSTQLPTDGLIAFHSRRARQGIFTTEIVLEEK